MYVDTGRIATATATARERPARRRRGAHRNVSTRPHGARGRRADGRHGSPQLRQYYDASYLAVSVLLLSPVVGYAVAAGANDAIHRRHGQRGIALVGPGLHVVAFLAVAQHPPYALLVGAFVLAGLGSGLVDAGWNAWIGSMPNSSGVMGALHSLYGVGAAMAPVVANAVVARLAWPWYGFYYLMALAALLELASSTAAFFGQTGARHRRRHPKSAAESALGPAPAGRAGAAPGPRPPPRSPVIQALANPATWLVSIFIFLYAGVEISLADWIMTLVVDHRGQTPFVGSMLTFAFWGGLTAGRIVVGFLIPLVSRRGGGGSKAVVTVCLLVTILAHLAFCLRADLATAAVAVPLLGFSLGPLFPQAVIMQTRLVDRHLHVAAVGFAVALGSAGGCFFPFLVGAIANSFGIQMLLPVVMVMLVLSLACWLLLPRPAEDDLSPVTEDSD